MIPISTIKNKYIRIFLLLLFYPFAFILLWGAYLQQAYWDIKPMFKRAWKGQINENN